MSDISIYRKALELTGTDRRFALASVIRAFGSTPQKAGANAIFAADGGLWGTLGGGCLEAECRRRALDALDEGSPQVFDLKLDDIQGWDDGLICGGRVRVYIDPQPQRNVGVYQDLLQQVDAGQSAVLLTSISDQELSSVRVVSLESWESTSKADALVDRFPGLNRLVENLQAGSVTGTGAEGNAELYYEPFVQKPQLVIAGAGHIGKATAELGRIMGFEVVVIDDRPALACAENLPDADRTICGDIAAEVAALATHRNSYIVIVTRGHRHDGTVLAAAVKKDAAFIGMIGSRRKGLLIREGLVAEGLATTEELERVCSPIGVDIGSVTVPEIALSIMTQLVAVRRKGRWGAPAMNYGLEDHGNRPRGGTVPADGAPEAAPTVGR